MTQFITIAFFTPTSFSFRRRLETCKSELRSIVDGLRLQPAIYSFRFVVFHTTFFWVNEPTSEMSFFHCGGWEGFIFPMIYRVECKRLDFQREICLRLNVENVLHVFYDIQFKERWQFLSVTS